MVFAPHGQQPFEGMAAPMMAGNPSEQWSPCPLSVRLEPSACPRLQREPARIRTVHELSGGVGAVSRELSASLGLPPSTTFLYFSDEFDEFVAMEDVTTLPKKCRVRPVLDATDEFE